MSVSKTHRRLIKAQANGRTVNCTMLGVRDGYLIIRRSDCYGEWTVLVDGKEAMVIGRLA